MGRTATTTTSQTTTTSSNPPVPGRKRGRPPKQKSLPTTNNLSTVVDSNHLNNSNTNTPTSTKSITANSRGRNINNILPIFRSSSLPSLVITTNSIVVNNRRNSNNNNNNRNSNRRSSGASTTNINTDSSCITKNDHDPNDTIEKVQFPRRHPRISGYYQINEIPRYYCPPRTRDNNTNIDDNDNADDDDNNSTTTSTEYISNRPVPIPMSNDIPFRTENEIKQNRIQYHYDDDDDDNNNDADGVSRLNNPTFDQPKMINNTNQNTNTILNQVETTTTNDTSNNRNDSNYFHHHKTKKKQRNILLSTKSNPLNPNVNDDDSCSTSEDEGGWFTSYDQQGLQYQQKEQRKWNQDPLLAPLTRTKKSTMTTKTDEQKRDSLHVSTGTHVRRKHTSSTTERENHSTTTVITELEPFSTTTEANKKRNNLFDDFMDDDHDKYWVQQIRLWYTKTKSTSTEELPIPLTTTTTSSTSTNTNTGATTVPAGADNTNYNSTTTTSSSRLLLGSSSSSLTTTVPTATTTTTTTAKGRPYSNNGRKQRRNSANSTNTDFSLDEVVNHQSTIEPVTTTSSITTTATLKAKATNITEHNNTSSFFSKGVVDNQNDNRYYLPLQHPNQLRQRPPVLPSSSSTLPFSINSTKDNDDGIVNNIQEEDFSLPVVKEQEGHNEFNNKKRKFQEEFNQQQRKQEEDYIYFPDDKTALTCLLQWNRRNALASIRRRNKVVVNGKLVTMIPSFTNNNVSTENSELSTTTTNNLVLDWRKQALETIPIFGDLRDDDVSLTSNLSTPVMKNVSSTGQNEIDVTWQTVYACANAIKEYIIQAKQLQQQGQPPPPLAPPNLLGNSLYNNNSRNYCYDLQQGIYLSSLLHFLRQAAKLPLPSNSFATSTDHNSNHMTNESIMQELTALCTRTRLLVANLLDAWDVPDGVDVEVLRKLVDQTQIESFLLIEYIPEMNRQINETNEWQNKVDQTMKAIETNNTTFDIANIQNQLDGNNSKKNNGSEQSQNDLQTLRTLYDEGKTLGFRSKGLVILEAKISKGEQLRERIVNWKESSTSATTTTSSTTAQSTDKKENIKFMISIVKEIHRVKLRFPEMLEFLVFHSKVDSWVDRASIAIRSRISLEEIKSLIEVGTTEIMPFVDLSDYMEKLMSRVELAEDWVRSFDEAIIRDDTKSLTMLEKVQLIRHELDDKENNCILHELASDGSRIPVEVECMKILQLELDSRGWSSKAKKWIPNSMLVSTSTTTSTEGNGTDVNGITQMSGSTSADNDLSQSSTPAAAAITTTKRVGKLEEIRDHLNKGISFHDRVEKIASLTPAERKQWILEGEHELNMLVAAADQWLEKYKIFLDIDGRCRNDDRNCISIHNLRQIVQEGNSIHITMGTPFVKITRILTQAENWHKRYDTLLKQCNIVKIEEDHHDKTISSTNERKAQLSEILEAIEAADSDISVDLDEATDLKALREQIEDWQRRVSLAIGDNTKNSNGSTKRTKKINNSKKLEVTVADLNVLIGEATKFPVDVQDHLSILQNHVDAVNNSQIRFMDDIRVIATAFQTYRSELNATYGLPSHFECEKHLYDHEHDTKSKSSTATVSKDINDDDDIDMFRDGDDLSVSSSAVASPPSNGGTQAPVCSDLPLLPTKPDNNRSNVNHRSNRTNLEEVVAIFYKRTTSTCVVTPERSIAYHLQEVSSWCAKSRNTLERQRDVFDKRFFGAFDRLVHEGHGVIKNDPNISDTQHKMETTECVSSNSAEHAFEQLRVSWTGVVEDQLKRLNKLESDRQHFIVWCLKAENTLADESKRLTFLSLTKLVDASTAFPSTSGIIRKVRSLHTRAKKWIDLVSKSLESPGNKLTYNDAKALADEGEKIGLQCNEIRVLRNGLKAARNWLTRYKKIDVETTMCHNVSDIKTLLEAHDTLPITMPEEVNILKQACKNYCLCRRPHDGFMIGCDSCDEWFHGPCIGVTETRADKTSKYICLKCCFSKVYKSSSDIIIDVIRKWTTKKDLKKARRICAQKHQRKVRKESKDLEKLLEEKRLLQQRLQEMDRTEQPEIYILTSMGAVSEVTNGHIVAEMVNNTNDERETDLNENNEDDLKVYVLPENITREDILNRLPEVDELIQICHKKQQELMKQGIERATAEKTEDLISTLLYKWCIRVRSLVLVPSSFSIAKECRPHPDGSLSKAMVTIMSDAHKVGIDNIIDVSIVINALKSICWSLYSRSVFRKQASVQDLHVILEQASLLELPDEKALKMLKILYQRCVAWDNKVRKAIAPCPGETKPFNMELLTELAAAGNDIPICMPLEPRLQRVIEDEGCRYCICGGPSDGRFMVACEQCDNWYHGHCVGISRHTPESSLTGWKCPICIGQPPKAARDLNLSNFHENFDIEDADSTTSIILEEASTDDNSTVSDTASTISELWPPFGLLGSATALEALGEECSAIPDCIDEWIQIKEEVTPQFHQQQQQHQHRQLVTSTIRTITVPLHSTGNSELQSGPTPPYLHMNAEPKLQIPIANQPGPVVYNDLSTTSTKFQTQSIQNTTYKSRDQLVVHDDARNVSSHLDSPAIHAKPFIRQLNRVIQTVPVPYAISNDPAPTVISISSTDKGSMACTEPVQTKYGNVPNSLNDHFFQRSSYEKMTKLNHVELTHHASENGSQLSIMNGISCGRSTHAPAPSSSQQMMKPGHANGGETITSTHTAQSTTPYLSISGGSGGGNTPHESI